MSAMEEQEENEYSFTTKYALAGRYTFTIEAIERFPTRYRVVLRVTILLDLPAASAPGDGLLRYGKRFFLLSLEEAARSGLLHHGSFPLPGCRLVVKEDPTPFSLEDYVIELPVAFVRQPGLWDAPALSRAS